ncbi:ABC transporter substrate-binding protein [Youhaiella tibetensis]|uniref:ABC transporter substrate-binding protein n=1 Tax=Paradevosia tibetensis TaxID=1447062 RepID=A0A5B9DR97_9HYPH|nr:ABC transporter substrate-binding protein [Youhaiella tibetensis]QEE21747.1 ABC transporter substrate-binding protein [Youhaiella tibetensis]
MRSLFKMMLAGVAIAATVTSGFAQEANKIVVGVQESGTVGWELAAMQKLGLDKKNNLDLEIRNVADSKAGQIALQSGAVDVILSDFVWVSLQRAQGNMVTMVPHSLAVGALMTSPDSGITKVEDLKGKTLAVAGSPVDKSWVILQAYYNSKTGGHLADDVSAKYGAPPLVNELLAKGEAPAALNNWNWNARAKVDGKVEVISVADMLKDLGVAEQPPLLGWTFTDATGNDKKAALTAFLNASFDTKQALLTDDKVWDDIRDMTGAKDNDALFAQIKNDYRAGIVQHYDPNHMEAAEQSFALMAKFGGKDVVGDQTALSDGTFWKGYQK